MKTPEQQAQECVDSRFRGAKIAFMGVTADGEMTEYLVPTPLVKAVAKRIFLSGYQAAVKANEQELTRLRAVSEWAEGVKSTMCWAENYARWKNEVAALDAITAPVEDKP